MLALAGERATLYGVTGWQPGTAFAAAIEGFKTWRAARGKGNDERRQIAQRVAGFIERHGDSRFSDATRVETIPVNNRAGYWRDDDGRIYLFTTDGMREALHVFDFKRALDVLQGLGALPASSGNGERSRPERIGGRKVRLYPIRADKLDTDHA